MRYTHPSLPPFPSPPRPLSLTAGDIGLLGSVRLERKLSRLRERDGVPAFPGVVVTDSYFPIEDNPHVSVKRVAHLPLPYRLTPAQAAEAVRAALDRLAEDDAIRSVALPTLGLELGQLEPVAAVRAMVDTVVAWLNDEQAGGRDGRLDLVVLCEDDDTVAKRMRPLFFFFFFFWCVCVGLVGRRLFGWVSLDRW